MAPKLTKDQSTLTQHHAFDAPMSSRSRSVEVDSISESESDFDVEERPRKKVKASGGTSSGKKRKGKFDEKEVGQTTYTQWNRDWSAKNEDDEFEIWEDSDVEGVMEKIAKTQHGLQKERTPEIPETSQNEPPASSNRIDQADANTTKFQTPRKVRFTEVPSSQTPPSTAKSGKSVLRKTDTQRSPLKERSGNAQSAAPIDYSPENQNISMKMPERVRFATRKVPLNDSTHQQRSTENARVAVEDVTAIPDSPVKNPTPTLARKSTIRDSQSEDGALSSGGSAENLIQPPRKLKRVATVQDSQLEEDEILSNANAVDFADEEDDNMQLVKESQYRDTDTQATFDPAMSALDRDASRFGWTQTQHLHSDVEEEYVDDETDDEDLDKGCTTNATGHTATPPSDPPVSDLEKAPRTTGEEHKEPHRRLPPIPAPTTAIKLARPDSRDDSASESGDHAPKGKEEIQILSSSPPPHPSQISTIVPTQASVREDSLSKPLKSQHTQPRSLAEPQSFTVSPHKPIQYGHLSSSPFPLPPWSSPEKQRFACKADCSPVSSSQAKFVVDYSLPPPPALSSSSGRGTPVSSGR